MSAGAVHTQDDAGDREKTTNDSVSKSNSNTERNDDETTIHLSKNSPLTEIDAGVVVPSSEPCVVEADGLSAKDDTAAEAMQLLAVAIEKNLITEEEKDRFVETILGDKSTIDGISRSLKCLIEESTVPSQAPNDTGTSSSLGSAKDEKNEKPQPPESTTEEVQEEDGHNIVVEGEAEEDDSSQVATDSDGALASVPLEASGMTNDSWEPANDLGSSTDDPNVSISAHSHSTILRSNAENIDGGTTSSGEQVRTVDFEGDAFDADGEEASRNHDSSEDEGSWTQIDADGVPAERQGGSTSQLGPFDNEQSLRSRTAGTTSTTSQQREGGQGEDWMRWVGGGLAVAGAVIGGIALANQNNNNSDRGQDHSRNAAANKKSNVTIELLDLSLIHI